jgi:uncharacterized coiled-coil DUF342 family protein
MTWGKSISTDENVIEFLKQIEDQAYAGSIQQQYQAALRRISDLRGENKELHATVEELARENAELTQKANHWDVFRKAIDEHPTVKSQWEKFLTVLRLCQGDGQ